MLFIYMFLTLKACNVVLKSEESIPFPEKFIFVFVPYFIKAIPSKIRN